MRAVGREKGGSESREEIGREGKKDPKYNVFLIANLHTDLPTHFLHSSPIEGLLFCVDNSTYMYLSLAIHYTPSLSCCPHAIGWLCPYSLMLTYAEHSVSQQYHNCLSDVRVETPCRG